MKMRASMNKSMNKNMDRHRSIRMENQAVITTTILALSLISFIAKVGRRYESESGLHCKKV